MEQELFDLPPSARLLALHKQGRVIRGEWHGISDAGRETACLYAALVPGARGTNACPARLMPQWLADLVPDIDDNGSAAAWPAMIERFARAVPIMGALTPEAERRVLAKTMLAALAIASPYNPGACAPVIAIWERELAGEPPEPMDWQSAQAVREGNCVASWAAAAAWATSATPWSARAAAAWATLAARAAQEDSGAAREAEEAAWDEISDALLTAVEAEA